jgi:hypothetical protein
VRTCESRLTVRLETSYRRQEFLLAVAVAPIIRYGAPWRTYNDKTNTTLAREIERTIINGSGNTWCGRSPWLIWNIHLGGELRPQFTHDYEALCFQVGRHRKHRASDRHCLAKANFDAACHRWQWKRLCDTVVLTPRGDMDNDFISKSTAKNMALDGWRRWMLSQDNRCQAIDSKHTVVTSAHSSLFHGQASWMTRFAVVGCIAGQELCKRFKLPS